MNQHAEKPAAMASECLAEILAWLASAEFRRCVERVRGLEGAAPLDALARSLGMPVAALGHWIARDYAAMTGLPAIIRDENDRVIAEVRPPSKKEGWH